MLLHRHSSEMIGREGEKMRGSVVKERLKGKDSLRGKKAQSVSDKKNRELLREGGKDTKGGRDKENKRGERG